MKVFWINARGDLSVPPSDLPDRELMGELLSYLDKVEVSDNDREFHPNKISSCRVMDGDVLDKILKEMKERVNATQSK